ncbi:MAG: hypothetical protein GXY33_09805 [Phycisphaerae bacterium]|nr:hypothetical protein [Phycisphaerae bacterium]
MKRAGLVVLTALMVGGWCVAGERAFTVGVKVHFTHRPAAVEQHLSLMKEAGVVSLYDDAYWLVIEQEQGRYAMPEFYDYFVRRAAEMGIEPVLVLAYWNPFYNGGGSPVTDESREGFARYCEFVVRHFGKTVRKYEIWNEWGGYLGGFLPEAPRTGQTIENYVKLAAAAYPRIKAADPEVTVLGGWMIEGWLDEFIALGGLKYVDAVSLHAYPYNAGSQRYTPEGWVEWMGVADRKLAAASPDRMVRFYLTETGWPGHVAADGTRADDAMDYAARMLLLARSVPRLAGVYWYDWQNDGIDPQNPEHNFGLLDADMTPKPAYFAYRDLAELVSTGEFLGRVEFSDSRACGVRYKRADGTDVLALWSTPRDDRYVVTLETDRLDAPPVRLQQVGGRTMERMWGALTWPDPTESWDVQKGRIRLTLSSTPWLVSGDLAGVRVLPEVVRRDFPESQRPGNTRLHIPREVAFATPASSEGAGNVYSFDAGVLTPVVELDAFEGVEGWSVYGDRPAVKASISLVADPDDRANTAAELAYGFDGLPETLNYCGYSRPMALPEDASLLKFRIRGDGSGHMVWVRLIDSSGELFSWCIGGVPEGGWTAMTLDLSRPADSHWDGNGDGRMDKPVSFHSLTIERRDRSFVGSGRVLVDDLAVERPARSAEDVHSFGLTWDRRHLYLTVNVKDAVHFQDFEDGAMWKGDSIQVALQALPHDGPMPRSYTELTCALTAAGAKVYRHSSQSDKRVGVVDDITAEIARHEDRTVYRVTIPVEAVDLPELEPGVAAGFSLLVNTNDGSDRGYFGWGGGIGADKSPMAFNWLMVSP